MAVDKLVDSAQLDADLTSVAAAIRTKGGTSGNLAFPAGFVSAIQAIPTGGGGGASNVVTGTFKGTTAGAAMDVTLNYTGSGYPIAVMIYPSEGPYNSSGTFYNLVQRYVVCSYYGVKSNPAVAPTYSDGSDDKMAGVSRYKSSSSNATSYSSSAAQNQNIYGSTNASSASPAGVFRIKSKTKLSVYIASSSYGFAANIEYTYWVIYSS